MGYNSCLRAYEYQYIRLEAVGYDLIDLQEAACMHAGMLQTQHTSVEHLNTVCNLQSP